MMKNTACILLCIVSTLLSTPTHAQPCALKQAIRAFEKGDMEQAQRYIDAAIQMPSIRVLPRTWYYCGVIYEKQLRDHMATAEASSWLAKAVAAYQHVLTLAPKSTQYHSYAQINLDGLWAYYLDRGRRYYKQEAFEEAIEQLGVCKTLRPQDPYAYLYTGIAAQQAEQYDLAWRSYTQYLALGASNPAVYRSMAHLAAQQHNNIPKALEMLQQGLQKYPWDNGLLQEQIQLYTALNQLERWVAQCQQQIANNPQQAAAYYQLGYIYEHQGQIEKALEYYAQAGRLAPQEAAPWRQQGLIHYNRALQTTQTIDELPHEAFQQMGQPQLDTYKTHLKAAKRCFVKALHRQRKDLCVLEHLHHVYNGLQQHRLAIATKRRLSRARQP